MIEESRSGWEPVVDIPAVLLIAAGVVSSVLLWFDAFTRSLTLSLTALTALCFLAALVLWCRSHATQNAQNPRRDKVWLLAVSAVGLFFRWGPYGLVQGGQDQGLYVNMAATLRRYGSVEFVDQFRAGLSPLLQNWYDRTVLSSFTLLDPATSVTNIEFYPLHPALMAIASWLGGGNGHIAMTVVSMIGVVAAWHLGRAIDPLGWTPHIFGFLMAVNPAMVFFAKFPVSESAAATFVILGFLYMIRAIRAQNSRIGVVFGVLSVCSFHCLMYVRWQFLLYLPFFTIVILVALLMRRNQAGWNRAVAVSFASCVLFGVSMVFYITKQRNMFEPVKDSIVDMLPSTRIVSMFGAVSAILVVIVWVLHRNFREAVHNFIDGPVRRLVPFLFPASLFLAVPGIIDLYQGEPMPPWGYVPPGSADPYSFRFHALYRVFQFVGPLLVVAVIAPFVKRKWSTTFAALMLFTTLCWLGILLRPFVPYLYYYGRYLVVDLVPAVILIASIVMAYMMATRFRFVAWGLIALSLAYGALFSWQLMGRHEGENANFFPQMAAQVDDRDIVVVSSASQQLMVPMRGIYGMDTLAVPELVEGGPTSADLFREFSRLAVDRGGRVLYLVLYGSGPGDMTPLWEGDFVDSYFTNTDHFRGGGLANYVSRRRLLLPTLWQNGTFRWQLFDMTDRFAG